MTWWAAAVSACAEQIPDWMLSQPELDVGLRLITSSASTGAST